jgi:hypothetical protein
MYSCGKILPAEGLIQIKSPQNEYAKAIEMFKPNKIGIDSRGLF